MANTKLTKRKEERSTQQVESDSDSESELSQNQGNGDLVMDNLSHVHNKCDDLMVKLKALNQAAVDIPMVSAVSTLPFVTPIITPVHNSTEVRGSEVENLSEVVATADAVSKNLISYLTGDQVDTNPVTVETNIDLEVDLDGDSQFVDKENKAVQPVGATVVINENGIHQPLKPIGKMLNELNFRRCKGRNRNDHIQESNIIVSTPVFDQCVSEFSMKTKQTPKLKQKELKKILEAEKAAKEKQKGVG